ncbi:hypothetical protein B566_EDAN003623 [Ephemera danica]|nr:hypothetical protein B566_EDAN003623 [Ephemera danica]
MHQSCFVVFCWGICVATALVSTPTPRQYSSPWSVAPGTNFTVPKVTPKQFRLANIYGSDMVLQMAPKRVYIWGYGQPFAEIVLRFNDDVYSTTVSRVGEWFVRLPPQPSGGPHSITIEHAPISLRGSETIELERVMFGDVWICSGGSNMAQELHSIAGWQEQVARARSRPLLRLYQASRIAAATPQDEGEVVREWEPINQDVILSYFPALCLLYGIEMTVEHPERPIGMIEAAWGGTPIQAWSSEHVFQACQQRPHPEHHAEPQHAPEEFHSHAGEHSRLGHPPTGGHHHSEALHAREKFDSFSEHHHVAPHHNMIMDWRKAFTDSDVPVPEEQNMHFPFGYVQLGPSRSERHEDWGALRLQQSIADSLFNLPGPFIPETFMASAYDLIDSPDVKVTGLGAHYQGKVLVANRLALAARQLMYDPTLVATGPIATKIELDSKTWLLNITYDKDIQVRGPDGFFVDRANGETNATEIVSSWSQGVTLRIPEDTRRVSYGWGALPCEHLRCAVYSVNPNGHDVNAATFRVANIYASSMVLQRAPKSTHIWGYGELGANITLSVDGHSVSTDVQSDDTWSLRLPPHEEGGPYEITIVHQPQNGSSSNVILDDVMFGDVWLCAGEENMELFMLSLINGTDEMELLSHYSQLRLMHMGHDLSDVPFEEPRLFEYKWSPFTNETLNWFSAVCALFARRVSEDMNGRPVGVIEVAWTRTSLQSWVSPQVTTKCDLPNSVLTNDNSKHNKYYNAVIYPLMKLAIRGAIWNQGESNEALSQDEFICATKAMAHEWREGFVDATVPVPDEQGVAFPFGIIQIGPDSKRGNENSTNVRLYQSNIMSPELFPEFSIPDSFSVATYDLADMDADLLTTTMYRDKHTVVTRLGTTLQNMLRSKTSLHGPKVELQLMTYDTTSSTFRFTYDSSVFYQNYTGFAYGTEFGNWVETEIVPTSNTTFTLFVPPEARYLTYAYKALPCSYLNASVYSDAQIQLPAEPLLWRWETSFAVTQHQKYQNSFVLFIGLLIKIILY